MTDERRQHLEAVEAVVKAFHYEPYDMAEEIVRLRAAIERVRALHAPVSKKIGCGTLVLCASCLDEDNDPREHPCPTLRALDGEDA